MVSRRDVLGSIIGGVQLVFPSMAKATLPEQPPITLQKKIEISPYVFLGEVERVDFVVETRDPETKEGKAKILDRFPVAEDRASGVATIKVIKIFKWPGVPQVNQLKTVLRGMSSDKQLVEHYHIGKGAIWFLEPGHAGNSDPPEFYGDQLVLRMPPRVSPEPPDRMQEVVRIIQELQK